MLNISILRVESPSGLWGRVVQGPGGDVETTDRYDRLLAQMNLFYHDLTRDMRELKPTALAVGQVCVVYWSVMKSWCRAVVESIIADSVSCQARCLLVDQGERLIVPSDKIRIAVPSFLQLPFWVRRFHLVGIEPTTLRVSVHEEKARLIPSTQWDSSATLYLHNLLQASTRTEAVLLESLSDSTAIELYLTVGNVKICVKDDLVAKRFAYYSGGLDEADRSPVMLSSSILTQSVGSTSIKTTAQTTQTPPGKRRADVTSCGFFSIFSPFLTFRCSLLEWLNPGSLNPDPDAADDPAAPSDPTKSGILVHSALPVEPCTSLDDAPITDALRWVNRKTFLFSYQGGLMEVPDRYSWPSVARGCNTVIVSPDADRPLGYFAPLISHILLNSIFASLTSSAAGPVAVLLCPGWEKVQAVYDLLEETSVAAVLHPVIVLIGVGKGEAEAVRIPKNCLLLVTTPFSLVRLLACHCFLFLRIYHLVLDEADQLFTLAPDQMATILQHFQKVTSSEEMASCPQQLVAVAKRWTGHMEGLVANHMPCPCVVVAVPEEAALYGNVQQVSLTAKSSKAAVMLSALDFNPDVGLKTLIVANSAAEVEDVFKVVSNKSAFCLKTHEGLTHQFDFVVQQWRKGIGPGTHIILVTTSQCLMCLGVRDATCVVHYGFPPTPKQFGVRLSCMAESFRNLSARDPTGSLPRLTRSVLLISERNACHVVGVLRYLGRTNAPLPPELLSFARGVHAAREDQKTDRPLCSYLKSFGVCRDGAVCPDRHRFLPQLDRSVLPASGVIEVVPLHVKTASVFWGRLVQKEEEEEGGGGFRRMASEMEAHYANGKPGAGEVLQGGFYAVQEDEVFHRVKILSVPDRRGRLFFSVLVRFIDVGKEDEVKSHQLLQLPERFHALPGQAVEVIVCRVKPVDGETDWHPKVTRAINRRIRGLQHRARAVFSLGNTVFVDPMVCVTQLPGMKTVINEYSVQSEILNTGMGVTNQQHLDLLRALCQEDEAGHISE
uniref:RNA helicase n=1 Tax=Cyclopterus lumpus TaxID=8103 RepID=A0A8C2Z2K6_CYCLU